MNATLQPTAGSNDRRMPADAVRLTPLQLNKVRYPVKHTPIPGHDISSNQK